MAVHFQNGPLEQRLRASLRHRPCGVDVGERLPAMDPTAAAPASCCPP